jgi:hypothetical protein
MSEKITSTFTFYGNQAALDLEKEIIRRFKEDFDNGGDKYTSVQRLLYGMNQEDQFDGYELLGAYQCWYIGSTEKFKVSTATCAPIKLQNHIAEYAAKIDPNVVVQMDYMGNTPQLFGTRVACFDKRRGILSGQDEVDLFNIALCYEDDLEEFMEESGLDLNQTLTYERLDDLVEETKIFAIDIFNSTSGRDIQYEES